MREIQLAADLEDMLESNGWKHVAEWMQKKTDQAKANLEGKSFTGLSEVKEQQARLAAYKELRAEIADCIRRGKEARKKEEAKEQG